MNEDTRQLAHTVTFNPRKRRTIFRSVPLAERGAIFERLSPRVQRLLLADLSENEIVDLLDQFDPREAKTAIGRIGNARRAKRILGRLTGEMADKATWFTRFHPKAALSLVSLNYVLLPSDTKIGEAIDIVEEHHTKTGRLPEILVHHDGALTGEVPLCMLLQEAKRGHIEPHVSPIATITYQADTREVVDAFTNTKHSKIAVLDDDGSVLGVVYSDDALSLIENDPASTLFDFAGVDEGERPFDSVMSKVRKRYRWLIINLGTAFVAAAVIGLFDDTLERLVILAAYMPVVAGMGGNAATQTLAVVVRGIAMGEIRLKESFPAIMREVGAGVVNGVITGAIVIIIASIWNGNPMLGVVVAIAMILNLVVAGVAGTLIPLVMKNLGKDPATSATIFITTATDVLGFVVFLGLASAVLL